MRGTQYSRPTAIFDGHHHLQELVKFDRPVAICVHLIYHILPEIKSKLKIHTRSAETRDPATHMQFCHCAPLPQRVHNHPKLLHVDFAAPVVIKLLENGLRYQRPVSQSQLN
jgi:hypothetical protein